LNPPRVTLPVSCKTFHSTILESCYDWKALGRHKFNFSHHLEVTRKNLNHGSENNNFPRRTTILTKNDRNEPSLTNNSNQNLELKH